MFGRVEQLLREGEMRRVDEELACADVETMNRVDMLAVLSVTHHARKVLPARTAFLQRAETRLRELLGAKRTARLLEQRR